MAALKAALRRLAPATLLGGVVRAVKGEGERWRHASEQRDHVILVLWTESNDWLQDGGALGGRVGPRAVERLGGFVRCLAQGAEQIALVFPAESPALAERDQLSQVLLPA